MNSDTCKIKGLFTLENLFPAYKRNRNLKEILSPSRYPRKQPQNLQLTSDPKTCKNCELCLVLRDTPTIKNLKTNETLKINKKLNCKSEWVIYVLEDIICSKQYVGSTINMYTRWCNHKSHIKVKYEFCNVVNHWWDSDNHLSIHLVSNQKEYTNQIRKEIKVVLVDQLDDISQFDFETNKLRLTQLESSWENRLHALERPHGLNVRKEKLN